MSALYFVIGVAAIACFAALLGHLDPTEPRDTSKDGGKASW